MPLQFTVQGPWKRYKRYSDNKMVEARLVEMRGEKFLQLRQETGNEFRCPACQEVLTQFSGENMPPFYLSPVIFHEKHKAVDDGR